MNVIQLTFSGCRLPLYSGYALRCADDGVGTAVGFATAFQAPIGGLMFAIEELATNTFSQVLGWQIFFACTVAVFTVTTFRSAQHALAEGQFGLFDGEAGTVLFEVNSSPTFSTLLTNGKLPLALRA